MKPISRSCRSSARKLVRRRKFRSCHDNTASCVGIWFDHDHTHRLRDIPSELYDAAKTDGCGAVKAFFCITLPQLKNVIFVNLVLQMIAAMQEFNAPYMITGGGPLKKTYMLGMLIYDEMFRYSDPGRANAVSWLLSWSSR